MPRGFYGPAVAAGAFSDAVGQIFQGMLESERRQLPIAEQAQRMGESERAEQRTVQDRPLDVAIKKAQLERQQRELPGIGMETITDKYGNVYRYDSRTGQVTPVLSGQQNRQIVGNRMYTEGPGGIQVAQVPMTPEETRAGSELQKFNLLKDPAARRKFLEDWVAAYYPVITKDSPVMNLYKEMARQYEAEQRRRQGAQFSTTTTETQTPRKIINDPMARMYVENQIIPAWLNRGADGQGRSQIDAEFPGFDNPATNVVIDPATGKRITKRLALQLKLQELGYEAKVDWNTALKKFTIGPLYSPGEVTQRVSTKAPLQEAAPSSIMLETE